MELRPGYKQTEIGVVPEVWDAVPFDAVFRRINAKNHQIQTTEYQETGAFPVIDQGQMNVVGYTDRTDKVFRVPKSGIIVFGDHTCIVKFVDHDFVVGADGTQILVAKSGHDTAFHAYALMHRGVEATGYNRHFKFLKERIFQAPSLPEQRAIAEALSDVDGLLDGLDRLITKKRDLKQGAMQRLLTGQTRLHGLSGEWGVKRLGSVLQFQVGFPFSSVFFNEKEQGIRLVKNRDLKTDDQVFHYSGEYDPQFLVRDGDLLVGMDGEFLPCLWSKGPALLNQRVGRVRPLSGLHQTFAFYCLIEPLKTIELETASTTVKHLSHGDIDRIERPLPSYDEQRAIAEVLSDMYAGIAALEQRHEKTRALKQAMMQELLTGKTRLVTPEAAHA
jgi:type I restriction enzyme S subunit